MRKNLTNTIFIVTITLVSIPVFAGARAEKEMDIQQPFDPNKKKVGDECKVSNECQKHHECTSNGVKNVCTAPPPPKLPPGVVT